jgi:hypothetical protein
VQKGATLYVATEDRFKQTVIVTLAKRAANCCSNPDCGAITSGPTDDPTGSVNVGEAAHIYGASPGSARFDPAMSPADRSSITNAIWLCGNCHKLVDDDPTRFPAGLLFEWQRAHEQRIAETIGKAGADVRRRYEERHLEEFGKLSYRAERIILEKPPGWEYLLTSEMLRFELEPIMQRWRALQRGLYIKINQPISDEEAPSWLQHRMNEVTQLANGFSGLMNTEFSASWGEPGVAGDEKYIVTTCRLFGEMCRSALEWEEMVRFAYFSGIFEETQRLFFGVGGQFIDEAAKLPAFLAEILNSDLKGEYHLSLVLDMPEGWVEAIHEACERATEALVQRTR